MQKGKVFSKIARMIAVAARKGGDPDMNPKLLLALDKARPLICQRIMWNAPFRRARVILFPIFLTVLNAFMRDTDHGVAMMVEI